MKPEPDPRYGGLGSRRSDLLSWRAWDQGEAVMRLRFTTEIFRMAAGISCALLLAAGAAPASAPGPLDVIGYSNPDESGPSKTWSLEDGLPYRYVPYVGDEVNGGIARLRMGARIGAALFQKPFFASRDRGCARDLGSDGRPDLNWLGPTARFEPGGDGLPPDAIAKPDRKTGGYGSMILFRKDLGPPPGLLLMNRRRTLGTNCLNAIHKTFFNRVFVPVAAAPERRRCFNLAGTFQIEGSAPQTFRFGNSDRLVLLAPSDLSERYRGIRHSFTATLYDRRDCAGKSVSFRSGALAPGSTKLDDFGFRDRTRSVKIAYGTGPLIAYMTPEAAPAAPAKVPAMSPAMPQASEPEPAAASEPVPRPAPESETMAKAPEPEPEPEPEVAARAPEPEAEPELEAEPESEVAAKVPEPAPAPESEPEPAPKQALEPTPAPASQRPLPEIKWDPPAQAAPTQSAPVQSAPVQSAAVPAQPTAPAAEPDPQPGPQPGPEPGPEPSPEPGPEPGVGPAAAPQTQPKLEPVLLPETQALAGLASQTFAYPVHQVYRLNYCLTSKCDCGAPAAQAWCKTQGFGTASTWKIDENIGSLFPTVVLGENRICAQFICDGFQEITCAN